MLKKQTPPTLLVLSGGLDSFVLAHQLRKEGRHLRAVYINFGKSVTRNEMAAVKHTALQLNFGVEILHLPGLSDMQLGYLSREAVENEEADMKSEPTAGAVGKPFVSGYQMLLGIASFHAQLIGSNNMALGLIKNQFDHCKTLGAALTSCEELVSSINPHLAAFKIETPFADFSKAEVVKVGAKLKVPFEHSWTCLNGKLMHCGSCSQCDSRKSAFHEAKIKDPTSYSK